MIRQNAGSFADAVLFHVGKGLGSPLSLSLSAVVQRDSRVVG